MANFDSTSIIGGTYDNLGCQFDNFEKNNHHLIKYHFEHCHYNISQEISLDFFVS